MSDSLINPSELGPTDLDDPLDVIVAQCLDSSEGDLRGAVDTACRANPEHAGEIRRRVAALRAAGLLRHEKLEGDEPFPERLGDFRLLRRLGGGGMGVVFRARQESLGREVALKLIRPEHMYFPRARERFRRETEAVARLQHPGIVPIYTVGEEQGLPYFAMELVAGCTLGEIVKDLQGRSPESLCGRDLREALLRSSASVPDAHAAEPSSLFDGNWIEACLAMAIQVARALHHAHGRGVLHRDVKPSNIALTFDGRAMLLDFGLASLEAEARVTQQGSALGSLLYMAPEQIRGDAANIDHRSDVYALGVTLYELLTLQAPYYDTNPVGTRQAILEGRADTIRVRNRAVPKDLETVCFKAMERDPARRYADTEALARDLANVLELRPIEARPPSTALRVRRWVQRNRAKSVALALGCLLVFVTPSALWRQQVTHARDLQEQRDAAIAAKLDADQQRAAAQAAEESASRERDRAQARARESESVASFLVDLFGAADPANARGRDLTARELLDLGVERIDNELAEEPDIQAKLLDRMAHSYVSLGLYDTAEPLIERALALRRERFGEDSLAVAESLFGLAHFERIVGRKGAAEHARRAVELRRELGPEHDVELARYLVGYAMALSTVRDYEAALRAYDEARQIEETLEGDQRALRSLILTNLANAYYSVKRFELAATVALESIALEREMDPKPHPALTSSLNTLALSLKYLERFEEARSAYDELLDAGRELHGEESDVFATFLMNKAALEEDVGNRADALDLLERAWAIFQRVAPPTHPQAIGCLGNLAGVLSRSGHWERARDAYRDVLPRLVDFVGPGSSRVALARQNLALCDEATGDFDAAEITLREALEAVEASSESGRDQRIARLRSHLARVLVRAGRLDEVGEQLEPALAFAAANPKYDGVALLARHAAAKLAFARGQLDEYESLVRTLVERERGPEEAEWVPASARASLAGVLAADGPSREGLDVATRATDELVQLLGPRHPESRDALERAITLGQALSDDALVARLSAIRDAP